MNPLMNNYNFNIDLFGNYKTKNYKRSEIINDDNLKNIPNDNNMKEKIVTYRQKKTKNGRN